jgi:hypothetical protein
MCVMCVNEYGTYDKCKTSSHAYDDRRARMNAHARAHKEQQSIKNQLQHYLEYSSSKLPRYSTCRRRVQRNQARTPAYKRTTTARSYTNIDNATVLEKTTKMQEHKRLRGPRVRTRARSRAYLKNHHMRRVRRGDPATNIAAIKHKNKTATCKSRKLTGDKEEAKDDNRRGVQAAAMVQLWYMCDKGV